MDEALQPVVDMNECMWSRLKGDLTEMTQEEIDWRHFLGFHQAVHLAMHWGQIRTIRNLYRKTRGEPARFVPDHPTFAAR